MVWSVSGSPERLVWESWEDESVLFDSASGQTHLLNALASEALDLLASSPMRLQDLVTELARISDTPVDDTLVEEVGSLLEQLRDLGIVEHSRDHTQ